jgi:plastocyanin
MKTKRKEGSMKNKGVLIGIIVVVIVAVVAVVLVNGNGKDSDTTSNSSNSSNPSDTSKSSDSSTSGAIATTSATLQNFAFSPAAIKVKVGDTVTWTNKDAVEHNVLAKTPSPDAPSSPLFGQDKTYQFTFNKAGTYTLYCDVHPYMHQVVEVTQ